MDALVRVNASQKNQVMAARFPQRVERQVDSVIDSRQVIQARRAIGVADGDKVSVAILPVDRHDSGRGESVDGSEDRSLDQPAVGERHEIVVTMDKIKLGGVL